ncbi:MAG: ubiquinol-cytochrome c reductase iron-sulfur subunit [Mangrovibacterium sp.]
MSINKIPNWRSDFPIRDKEAVHVSRREFAKFLSLFSGALALGSGAIVVKTLAFPGEEPEGEHFICEESEVLSGSMFQFELGGNKTIPYLLIHLPDGEWRAFEQKCTHLSCAVHYVAENDRIECPCHKGFFNSRTGDVIEGPPPRPLPQLEVVRKDGKIFVRSFKNS